MKVVSTSQTRPQFAWNKLKMVLDAAATKRCRPCVLLTLFSIYTHFNTLNEQFHLLPQCFPKAFLHNVFHATGILKSFNSHISVVNCSLFEFWTVSKWCTREWVKVPVP